MSRDVPVIQAAEVTARHIRRGISTDLGAVQVLDWWRPERAAKDGVEGLVGEHGFQSGQVELRRDEEGTLTLLFPNSIGADGVLHRERFEVFTRAKGRVAVGEEYRPGDEWIELYRDDSEQPMAVATPLGGRKSISSIELRCADAFWTLKKTRETAAGFWTGNAPRDVWEHYSQVWRAEIAEGFEHQSFTYATSFSQNTPDGLWRYFAAENAAGDAVRLRPVAGGVASLYGDDGEIPVGTASSEPHGAWRLEVDLEREAFDGPNDFLYVGLVERITDGELLTEFVMTGNTTTAGGHSLALDTEPGRHRFVIEGRGRWIFYYLDGDLKWVGPMPTGGYAGGYVPKVRLAPDATPPVPTVTVHSVFFKRLRPYLLRGAQKGDYQLPGAPPLGGLVGSYFAEQEIYSGLVPAGDTHLHVLKPTRSASARRIDPTINFAEANPVAWAAGGLQTNFSTRWTGAIFLELAPHDVLVRATANDRVRVWIGKTRFGEQVIDDWTNAGHGMTATSSAGLRSSLGQTTGWYPIVIEYSNDLGAAGLILESSKNGGSSWQVVPSSELSPLGCYEGRVQGESHYELLRSLMEQFGIQTTCEPRQLESGEFPGQLVPRVRVGRDTAKVLTSEEASDIAVDVSAEETADVLLADAAGLATDGAQLSVEAINFDGVASHPFLQQEAESLADVTIESNALQRLDSLLALRSAPWEEIGARPGTRRERVDSLPLTGTLAEFLWEPGDAVALDLDELDVHDATPRPLLAITWPFVPEGLSIPQVTWRQRPRNLKELLRRHQRRVLGAQRTYQGQLVVVSGNAGRTPAPSTASGGIADNYSRVNLPPNLAEVLRAEFVVQTKSDGSSMNIEVNGTNRLTFTAPGRYDITTWVARMDTNGQRMIARATGGSGSADYALELLVAI